MNVAIIGGHSCSTDIAKVAEEAGRAIAQMGHTLICGGLGGVMEAACRGAKSVGGKTIGILPGHNKDEANPYVDLPIVTGLGEARNAIVVRTADAVVAISGGYGTLSEIGLALKMGRPVVGLGTWELGRPGEPMEAVVRARTPQEAVALALARAAPEEEGQHG